MNELVIVLAPRTEELRPDMNAQKYSNGLTEDKIKRLKWDKNCDIKKTLELEVDEQFLLAANTYVTITCPQTSFNTDTWRCKNNDTINSANVCNSFQSFLRLRGWK